MRADIVPGGIFPDYERDRPPGAVGQGTGREFTDDSGASAAASAPRTDQQHLELAADYPKIRVAYTQIVTISTDNILKTNEFRDSVGVAVDLPVRRGPQDPEGPATSRNTPTVPRPDDPGHACAQGAGH